MVGDAGLDCSYCGRHLTYNEMRDNNCLEPECPHCDDWPEDACEELKSLRKRIAELKANEQAKRIDELEALLRNAREALLFAKFTMQVKTIDAVLGEEVDGG